MEELAVVYMAAETIPYPFGPLVQLLILTGQRRGEIAALRWEWIRDGTILLPKELTKNHRDHFIPLTDLTAQVLARIPILGAQLFPASRSHVAGRPTTAYNGFTKDVPALRRLVKLDHFTLHDLRRSFSSQMAALGVPQLIVEKLLNHVSGGVQSPIARVYNRYSYASEMGAALASFHAKLEAATTAD